MKHLLDIVVVFGGRRQSDAGEGRPKCQRLLLCH